MADYTGDPRQAPAGTVVQMWGGTDPVYAEGDGKFYQIRAGTKTYVPAFVVMQGYHPGDEFGPDGQLTAAAAAERTAQNVPDASLFHNRGEFDPTTGDYKQGLNWGNIMSMVVAGVLTAGMADIIMSAPAGTAAAAAANGTIPTTEGLTGAELGGAAATQAPDVLPAAIGGSAAATPAALGSPGSEGYAPGNTFDNGIPSGASDAGSLASLATKGTSGAIPDWLKTVLGIAGPIAGGIGEGLLTQHRNSFSGTASDPVKLLGETGPMMDDFRNKLTSQMATPPPFSADATPQQPPVFAGPGLPGPIGLSGQATGVRRKPVSSPQDAASGDDVTRATKALSILGYG